MKIRLLEGKVKCKLVLTALLLVISSLGMLESGPPKSSRQSDVMNETRRSFSVALLDTAVLWYCDNHSGVGICCVSR
jgi:hypothetical protein